MRFEVVRMVLKLVHKVNVCEMVLHFTVCFFLNWVTKFVKLIEMIPTFQFWEYITFKKLVNLCM